MHLSVVVQTVVREVKVVPELGFLEGRGFHLLIVMQLPNPVIWVFVAAQGGEAVGELGPWKTGKRAR